MDRRHSGVGLVFRVSCLLVTSGIQLCDINHPRPCCRWSSDLDPRCTSRPVYLEALESLAHIPLSATRLQESWLDVRVSGRRNGLT